MEMSALLGCRGAQQVRPGEASLFVHVRSGSARTQDVMPPVGRPLARGTAVDRQDGAGVSCNWGQACCDPGPFPLAHYAAARDDVGAVDNDNPSLVPVRHGQPGSR